MKQRRRSRATSGRNPDRNAGGRGDHRAVSRPWSGRTCGRTTDTAKITAARTQIESFTNALGQYKLDTGTFPTTEQGLQALRVKPQDATQWAGPYMTKEIPKDPWGHDYVYKYPGEHGDEPDIVCYGQDGQPGGEGLAADIDSWKN